MRRLPSICILACLLLAIPGIARAQDDPRLSKAVEHFQNEEYVQAAELLEQVEKDAPSNLLRLNAMAAWYKADRCEEAMAARSRVDRTVQLAPQDIEDLDRVNAYCKLKSARAFRESHEWDKALGLLAGLETQDEKLTGEIVALRQEIELEKQHEQEQAELDKPGEVDETVEPPPQPEPVERPKWALYTGIGLLGGGAALGIVTLVKWRGIDRPNMNDGWEAFAVAYDCAGADYANCDEARIRENEHDQTELEAFQRNINTASAVNVTMGITAGLAGAAGGLLLYYALKGDETAAAVAPLVSPDSQGLVLSLQF